MAGRDSSAGYAVLFDLDDTLVVEDAAAAATFRVTAAAIDGLDAGRVASDARECARDLWRSTPVHGYCMRVGISSSEGLWCRFAGEEPNTAWLRAWAPEYRRETWSRALARQGARDDALAEELGERFAAERRTRHEVFADAEPVLAELGETHALALVTNGAACLQREKLAASGLAGYFSAIVISADLGVGKPAAAIFQHTLAELGCDADRAVMVGDSHDRDIEGALAAGLGAVWLNRDRDPQGPREIRTLVALPALLNDDRPGQRTRAM
jgi:putative hydrolase of the HAD superfamily